MTRRPTLLLGAALLLVATTRPAMGAAHRWVDEEGVVNLTNDSWHFESHRPHPAPADAAGAPARPGDAAGADVSPDASAPADEGPGPRQMDGQAEEVARLSGLDAQAELLAAIARAEFERWRSPRVERARAVVLQSFGPEALRRNMRSALARRLDAERRAVLLAWLRTPLSRRIVALEGAAASPEARAERTAFVNRLPATPLSPARLALLHRLDRAGEITQSSAIVIGAATLAVRQAIAPFLGPGGVPRSAMTAQSTRPTIDEAFRFRVMASIAFEYRELGDAELARYVAFVESPAGRWFTQASRAALISSLEQGARDQPEPPGAVTAARARKAR